MKKTLIFIILIAILIAISSATEIPINSKYISIYEAEFEILGNWKLDSYNGDNQNEGILRFEENYIYAESSPNDSYIEGKWQIIEQSNELYILLWNNHNTSVLYSVQLFKIIFSNKKLYLINSSGNYYELEREESL